MLVDSQFFEISSDYALSPVPSSTLLTSLRKKRNDTRATAPNYRPTGVNFDDGWF
jgi:hypothetical protein